MFYDLRDKIATGRLISGLKNVGSYIPGALVGGAGGVLGGSISGGLVGSVVGGIRDDITWKEGARRGIEAGALLGGAAGATIGAPLHRALKKDPHFVLGQITSKIMEPSHKVPWFINPNTINRANTIAASGALAAALPFMDEKMAGAYARSPYLDKRAFNWTSPIALTYGGLGALAGLGAGYDPYGVKEYDYAKGLGGAAIGGALGYGAGHLQKAFISDVADSWANPWGGGAYPIKNAGYTGYNPHLDKIGFTAAQAGLAAGAAGLGTLGLAAANGAYLKSGWADNASYNDVAAAEQNREALMDYRSGKIGQLKLNTRRQGVLFRKLGNNLIGDRMR